MSFSPRPVDISGFRPAGRPRIAHVVFRCVPGDYRGGVEKMVVELAEAQAAAGHAVEILTVGTAGASLEATAAGVPIQTFPAMRIGGTFASPTMVDFIRAQPRRYDLLHTHNIFHPLNAQVRRVADALALPFFAHAHGALDPKLLRGVGVRALKKKFYIAAIERPNLNHAAAVFALSEEERAQLRSLGVTAPIEIVPNGIAPPLLRDAAAGLEFRRRSGIAPDAPLILFLGRVVAKKRLEDVFEALALVRESHPDASLMIGGNALEEPRHEADLRQLAEARGIAGNIHWLGFLDEAHKAPVLSAADMFVHASHSEGMAMAILEAMAAGLPTVVTRGCYMGEAAAAGAVVEVEGGADAVAEGLLRLIEDATLRGDVGAAAARYAAAHHGWPALAERVLAAYGRYSGAAGG